MKKIKLFLLLLLFAMIYVINIDYVKADEGKNLLKVIALQKETSNYQVGEKLTFNVDATEEISSMQITFRNPVSKDGHYYGSFVVNLTGNCTSGSSTKCTFTGNIPEKIDGYYGTEENNHIEMTIYSGTYEVSTIFVYDKNGKLTRYTTDKEYADSSDFLYYQFKIGINVKETETREMPDILKSISLVTRKKQYYLGDKLVFNVESTDEISSIAVFLDGPMYIYTSLLPECPANNKTKCTFTGYIPRTRAGYIATVENGRTELEIAEGTYKLADIIVYDKNGEYIRYTNKKEVADKDEETLYNQYETVSFNIKEPTGDELNDVNFVLNKFTLKNKTAAIGKPASLDIKYSYEDTKKKLKSMYLIFRDSNKKRTFTSAVKSLYNNPYFIVASSADLGTYKLDGIGITFEAKDGTENTIILNATSNGGKYNNIFNQTIEVTEKEDDSILYLSAEELDNEIYQKIINSNEETVIIDADNYTIIPSKIFDLIKENTKKLVIRYNENEWIFNGVDIKTAKDINVLINFYQMNASDISENLKKALNEETVIIDFPNNGKLPGDVLIRLKNSEIIDKLNGEKYYIYYVDNDNGKLKKVALEVEKTADGYIEFYINHNSKYLISSTEITDQTILGEDDSIYTKNSKLTEATKTLNKNPILKYSIIAVAFILIIIVFIVIIKRHNKTFKNKSNNSQTNENN